MGNHFRPNLTVLLMLALFLLVPTKASNFTAGRGHVLVNTHSEYQEEDYPYKAFLPIVMKASPSTTPMPAPSPQPTIPPDSDMPLKVAFISDSESMVKFDEVLELIKAEGAELVLEQADYGEMQQWEATINTILGPDFPYLGPAYSFKWPDNPRVQFFLDRIDKMGGEFSEPPPGGGDEYSAKGSYSVAWRGLKLVFSTAVGHADWTREALMGDTHTWRICSWHEGRADFTPGGKGDSTSLEAYKACAEYGAIIANGNDHLYGRTCTLVDMANPSNKYGADCSPANQLRLGPGSTFVFVSGLAGHNWREYREDLHDDDGWWGTIYTSTRYCRDNCTRPNLSGQDRNNDITPYNIEFGALFITFNVNGNPNQAHGYFKTLQGELIDEFDITVQP